MQWDLGDCITWDVLQICLCFNCFSVYYFQKCPDLDAMVMDQHGTPQGGWRRKTISKINISNGKLCSTAKKASLKSMKNKIYALCLHWYLNVFNIYGA